MKMPWWGWPMLWGGFTIGAAFLSLPIAVAMLYVGAFVFGVTGPVEDAE